jgi:hypothetical protein
MCEEQSHCHPELSMPLRSLSVGDNAPFMEALRAAQTDGESASSASLREPRMALTEPRI